MAAKSLSEQALDEFERAQGIDRRTSRQRNACKVRPFANSNDFCGNEGKRQCHTCGTRMCDQCTKSIAPGSLDCVECYHFHFSND